MCSNHTVYKENVPARHRRKGCTKSSQPERIINGHVPGWNQPNLEVWCPCNSCRLFIHSPPVAWLYISIWVINLHEVVASKSSRKMLCKQIFQIKTWFHHVPPCSTQLHDQTRLRLCAIYAAPDDQTTCPSPRFRGKTWKRPSGDWMRMPADRCDDLPRSAALRINVNVIRRCVKKTVQSFPVKSPG